MAFGLDAFQNVAVTGAVNVLSKALHLYELAAFNPSAAIAHIQIFDNSGTAGVTLGTTAALYILTVNPADSTRAKWPGLRIAKGLVFAPTTTATGSTGVVGGVNVEGAYG